MYCTVEIDQTKGDTLKTHPIKGRKMHQELNKQGVQNGTHDGHSHHNTKTDIHNPSHEKIEVIDQQQVK
jgi:hypothetical protein